MMKTLREFAFNQTTYTPPIKEMALTDYSIAMAVIYNTLHAVGIILNLSHLMIISRLAFRFRHGGAHLRVFLNLLAVNSFLNAASRLMTSNRISQKILIMLPVVCQATAIMEYGIINIEIVLLSVFVYDRLKASLTTPDRYWQLSHVAHYNKLITILLASVVSIYTILGMSTMTTGYQIVGLGPCQVNLSTLNAWLGISFLSFSTIGFLFMVFGSMAIVKSLASDKASTYTVRQNRTRRELARLAVSYCVLKLYTLMPPATLILTHLTGESNFACRWFSLISVTFSPIFTPIIFAVITQRYRYFVRTRVHWVASACKGPLPKISRNTVRSFSRSETE